MTQRNQYVHGYDQREQDRLISQADHWRAMIVQHTPLHAGERLLEVGCGAGAVLGVLGKAYPEAALHGIDIEPAQIAAAEAHLAAIGVKAEVKVAAAGQLPWADGSFDHVFFMWMLEHLTEHDSVLREARRVLKPGGTVHITETDYNFVTHPPSADFAFLMEAWRKHFTGRGDALLARKLGPLLLRAGFANVKIGFSGFHNYAGEANEALFGMANYHADYVEPEIEAIAAEQLVNVQKLRRGVEWLRALADQPDASISGTVYRATATA
ncbi:MAG TPA: methyltransferase domain-containing protein [Tepidisphaeraceae bacterium]|nr:methyltransferase domain-containing protein [Tepidisphaeraceae bacterium]